MLSPTVIELRRGSAHSGAPRSTKLESSHGSRRLVPVEGAEAALQSAVLTHFDGENVATLAFQRRLSKRATADGVADTTRPVLELAA